MTCRGPLATLLLLAALCPVLAAEGSPKVPVSGTVVDVVGNPVAGATVVLTRQTFRALDYNGISVLATTTTDDQGRFSLGDVALNAEVAFPLETGVLLEFTVSTQGTIRHVDDVRFTAPRTETSTASSVAAEIQVH
jgi:hypothetical protein